jgi:hypothetical protein
MMRHHPANDAGGSGYYANYTYTCGGATIDPGLRLY